MRIPWEIAFQETSNWQATLIALKQEGFITYNDETLHTKEDALFDRVIDDYPGNVFFAECEHAIPVLAHHRDSEALLNLAEMFRDRQRYEETIRVCAAILKIDPQSAQAYCLQGFSANSLGRFEEGIELLSHSLKIMSLSNMKDNVIQMNAWLDMGFALKSLKKYTESINAYDHILALAAAHDIYGACWCNKGNIFSILKNNKEAIEAYEKALTFPLDRNVTVLTLCSLGSIFSEEMRLDEALLCYDEALRLDPRFEPLWAGRARTLHYLNRYVEALESAKQAYVLDPKDTIAQQVRVLAESDIKIMKMMLDNSRTVLTQNPTDAKAVHRAGVELTNLGEHEQALQMCEYALQINQKNVEVWILKGFILFGLKKYELALAAFDQALALDSHAHSAQSGKERVLRALSFLEKRKKARGSLE